jgi:predicted O-methyltransferase YrrM
MDKLKWSIAQLVKDIDPQVGILDKEGCLLFDYASKIPTKGLIIEIGSWRGRSTVWLGQGAMFRGGKVLAVDPHQGMEGYGESYTDFIENIKRCKVSEVVMPILMTSKAFFEDYQEKVDMVFIDGLHDYSTVLNDTLESLDHLKENGILAMHDTVAYVGPYKVLKMLLFWDNRVRALKQVGQVAVLRKTKPNFLNIIPNTFFYLYLGVYSFLFLTVHLFFPKFLKEKIKSV